jgi:mannose-1-phosphate guanylyltransferase/phosphomannomutase
MAGGAGTRLRPLTSNAPKPMMPIVNRPMMEHIVSLLKRHGFDEIVVTVAFMANNIREHFGDGSDFGVRMVYATEETPLGTAGSVRNAMEELTERFLVISGDVLTDIDLGSIVRFHDERKAMATIGLISVEDPVEFGIVITREDGSIERFLEKPTWGQVFSDTINTGIFVLEPEIFDFIAPDQPVDFSSEVFPAVLEAGLPMYGALATGYWEDVGNLEAYLKSHKDVLDNLVGADIDGFEISDGVWLGEGAQVDPAARVEGPAVIGPNCRVEAGARLGPYTVLGANVRVRNDADLERVVVHDNAYLDESVELRGAVIGRSSDLRRNVRCDEGSVLGDECFVGEDAVVGAGVKVYPFKTIEAGAVVNSSIVWESRGARSLFGRNGVTGLANVDITPELATRLAMAYAGTLKAGATVVTSRDTSRSARMLKRAMMAGLNAAGVNAMDLEVAALPVSRFVARQPNAQGGISLSLAQGDPRGVVIRFFDEDGLDIREDEQRKIDRLLGREDFRRVPPSEIGDILFPPRALEQYSIVIENALDTGALRSANLRAVVDMSYGSSTFTVPNVMSKLNTDVLAVNPYASTLGVVGFDMESHCAEVAKLVAASGAALGAVIDPIGERLMAIDNTGRVLTNTQLLLSFLTLLVSQDTEPTVVLPVATTRAAADLVRQAGGTVVDGKMSVASLLHDAARPVGGRLPDFAAGLDGGYAFPQFLPAFDGTFALAKLLELLAVSERPLSDVVDGLPEVTLVRDTEVTPWEQKGAVMRMLMEQSANREVELIDGVKVHHDDGWLLALPDPEEPVTRFWAEASTADKARDLIDEYRRRIRTLLRSEGR